jgi:acetate kinase
VQLTDAAIDKIRAASVLAPLHNPPGLQGIEAAMQVFRGVPQVRDVTYEVARWIDV